MKVCLRDVDPVFLSLGLQRLNKWMSFWTVILFEKRLQRSARNQCKCSPSTGHLLTELLHMGSMRRDERAASGRFPKRACRPLRWEQREMLREVRLPLVLLSAGAVTWFSDFLIEQASSLSAWLSLPVALGTVGRPSVSAR